MKIVTLLSGGMDSAVLMYKLIAEGHDVVCLGVNYGQRHSRELTYAAALAKRVGAIFRVADLSGLTQFFAGSSQTDSSVEVPEGHYADKSMRKTVVPNRNMLMLSVASAWAISSKLDAVAYAAHSGDHAVYPDCRREFAEPLGKAIQNADWHHVTLLSPFIDRSKTDIARVGKELGVPFEETWSCYKGASVHCGRCGTCAERLGALHDAGVEDKTVYTDREFWKEALATPVT